MLRMATLQGCTHLRKSPSLTNTLFFFDFDVRYHYLDCLPHGRSGKKVWRTPCFLAFSYVGDRPDLRQSEKDKSRRWRDRVRKVKKFLGAFETEPTNQIPFSSFLFFLQGYNRPNNNKSEVQLRCACTGGPKKKLRPAPEYILSIHCSGFEAKFTLESPALGD